MTFQNITKWLLLIHQIPPKPDYFRVKIWRRLRKVGAVAIKQSVYVLPDSDLTREDLSWIVKEIDEGGGTASLCRSEFIEGLSDDQIKRIFQKARNEDYAEISAEVQSLRDAVKKTMSDKSAVLKTRSKLTRLRHRFEEVGDIDFFSSSGQKVTKDALSACESALKMANDNPATVNSPKINRRTWVTRKNVYVDRIASAWLIRRFIDRDAQFKFVTPEKYESRPGEYRFDMFEAEFTHEGDKCSFEVLVDTFQLTSSAIAAIAEIIHDIDLKDKKFDRLETSGIQALFSGVIKTHTNDGARLERGALILDELYAYFLSAN
jgi:hypothetical protein